MKAPGERTRGSLFAVALVLLGAQLSACVSQPPRSDGQRASDARLAAEVERVLRNDDRIYSRHIDVDVTRSVVSLSGFVYDTDDLYEARRMAASVPGVAGVKSSLELLVGGRGGNR